MPHLIFQTKFPMNEQVAEITFFGCIERETMDALQQTTFATLQRNLTNIHGQQEQGGAWTQSPYSGHVVHFVVNVPGNWQLRHTLQNILRVAWMDIFEKAGWTLMSMWNCNSSSSTAGVNAGGVAATVGTSDKALAFPLLPSPPPPTASGGKKDSTPQKEVGEAGTEASEGFAENGIAPNDEAATRSQAGAAGGDDGTGREIAGNKADGGGGGSKAHTASDFNKFEGECANFLLFKASTTSGVGGLISPHVTSLETSLFLGGMSAARSESAAQQLMLASLPWLGAKSVPADSGKGKGRAEQNASAMAAGEGSEAEKAPRISASRPNENPTDELLVAATMAAAEAEREASGVASRGDGGGKRKSDGAPAAGSGARRGAGEDSRSGSTTKKRKAGLLVLLYISFIGILCCYECARIPVLQSDVHHAHCLLVCSMCCMGLCNTVAVSCRLTQEKERNAKGDLPTHCTLPSPT